MLTSKQLSPFGVHVDLDLRQRSGQDNDELRALLARHHLLVFESQALTMDEQIAFMELFGPVLHSVGGVGYITNEKLPDNVLADSELAYHSDLSFCPKPFDAISLHAVQVEDGQSSTLFVDATLAYARLPDELKQRIRDCRTLQIYGYNLTGRNFADLPSQMPRHIHPLVMTHPRTGEKILMSSKNHSACLPDLEEAESTALLDELFAHMYSPDAILEHVWRNGDLVVWDNLAIQHARRSIANVGLRRLQRVVVAEADLLDQFPDFEVTTSAVPDVPVRA